MNNEHKNFLAPALRLRWGQLSGVKLLLPLSALMSLGFVGYFIAGLRGDIPDNDPIFVTNRALTNWVKAASTFTPRDAVSDVVSKALAFKALLTTTQQQTLELTYTAALARKWSNLPCGSSCRNGIGLGTLTAAQLAAALDVIRAVEGTAANEGFDEFQQIRLADTYLAQNGGGSGYGEGLFYLAFLNTPSNTGPWMMQFGGHHYAANIGFNQGHIISTTPHFYGLEPLSFTVSGTTYAPLTQEHDTLTAMLASLSAAQLTTAKLSQTFSDATMIPGETNGGNGTFPTTKVGLAVSNEALGPGHGRYRGRNPSGNLPG